MTSPSPASVEPQFHGIYDIQSNHDRCTRCGSPRSAHGIEWSCPPMPRRSAATYPLVGGAVLTLIGLIWTFLTPDVPNMPPPLGAVLSLGIGVTMIVFGLILRRGLRD